MNEDRLSQFITDIIRTGNELALQLRILLKDIKSISYGAMSYYESGFIWLVTSYTKILGNISRLSFDQRVFLYRVEEAMKSCNSDLLIATLANTEKIFDSKYSSYIDILHDLETFCTDADDFITSLSLEQSKSLQHTKLSSIYSWIDSLFFHSSSSTDYNEIFKHVEKVRKTSKTMRQLLCDNEDIIITIQSNPSDYVSWFLSNNSIIIGMTKLKFLVDKLDDIL